MNNYTRYSFFQLFTKSSNQRLGNYKIVVPIIQRDYAQGRTNEKANAVRKDFLSQLEGYMATTTGSHDLDFVYGVSSPAADASKKTEFIPLDGQQRLTTLFLLHYYFAVRTKGESISDVFFKTLQTKTGRLRECLFAYRTRSSATDFCNSLVSDENDFSELFVKDEKGRRISKKKFSDLICNTNWFYPDWLQDPTVKAILKMLDDIDIKFDNANHKQYLSRLMSDDDPSVTFIFMDLDDYNLTDDLYIKMNSRGKPLTSFENFKAKYEQYIGVEEQGHKTSNEEVMDTDIFEYVEDSNGEKRKVNRNLYELSREIKSTNNKIIDSVKTNFSHKLDTVWSNLFWEFSKDEIRELEKSQSEGKEKSFDKLLADTLDVKLSKFIKMILANQYAIDHRKENTSIPEELIGEKELSFSELESIDALSADGIVLLTRMFELYTGQGNKYMSILPDWVHNRYYSEKDTFELLVKDKPSDFTFFPRLMLYAYSAFRLKFGDDCPQQLTEWMRFIYNMTYDDNTIQSITSNTYSRAIYSVNNLLSEIAKLKTPSIIHLLANSNRPNKVEFFPEFQYREEILKSCLFKKSGICILHQEENPTFDMFLNQSDSWEKIILTLESHPYFTGQIGFILKMAGIDDYFLINGNLDWNEHKDLEYKAAVIKYGRIATKIFEGGYSDRKLAKNSLFERAMLAKYPGYYDWNLFNSTNRRTGSNNLLRDRSWKTNLRLSSDYEKVYEMVKGMFDSLEEQNPEETLHRIIAGCENIKPLWRNDMVRLDYLIGMCRNGFFYKANDGHRILIDRINFSNTDHEVYSYVLYQEYLKQIWDHDNSWLEYKTSNSGYDDIPHVIIHVNTISVKIKSYVNKDDGELKSHYLWIDTSGDKWLESYLADHGFVKKTEMDSVMRRTTTQWESDKNMEIYRSEVTIGILNFIKELSTAIKNKEDGQGES